MRYSILFCLWALILMIFSSHAQKEPFRQDIVGQIEPLLVSVKTTFELDFKIKSSTSPRSFLNTQPPESYLRPNVASARAYPQVLYQHRIHFPRATYLSVHFAYFNLPPTDFVVIQSRENPEISFTYRGTGRANLGLEGGFFATHVPRDDLLILYYTTSRSESSSDEDEYGYVIDGYARGMNTPEEEPEAKKEPKTICDRDFSKEAKCYAGEPQVYRQSQAVARLLVNGISSCTAWLIGCEGHLLTNHHCISSNKSALNTDVEFMAEAKSCDQQCRTSFSCRGTVKTKGLTLIHANKDLDYALLKLNIAPSSYAQLSYLQLRATTALVNEPIYIPQHPRGMGKKIAMFVNAEGNNVATITRTNISNECGADQLGYLADTQPGSSGAPVVSLTDHAVIGLHHCGGCENTAHRANTILGDLTQRRILPKCAIAGSTPPPPFQGGDDSVSDDDDNNSEVRCVLKLSGCEPASKCQYDVNLWTCVLRK